MTSCETARRAVEMTGLAAGQRAALIDDRTPVLPATPATVVVVDGPSAATLAVASTLAARFGAAVERYPTGMIHGLDQLSDPVVCLRASRGGWFGRFDAMTTAAIGPFAGPVVLVGPHCPATWTPGRGDVLAAPSPPSMGWELSRHAATWALALDVDLWLSVVIDRTQFAPSEPDAVARADLLAAGLLGRMSRDLELAGVDTGWDVLFGRTLATGIRSFASAAHPTLIAVEAARTGDRRRDHWGAAFAVARFADVPVLVLPPTPPRVMPLPPPPALPLVERRAERVVMPRLPPTAWPISSRQAVLTLLGPSGDTPKVAPVTYPPAAPAPPSRRRTALTAVGILALVASVLAGVARINVPYYAVKAGPAPPLGALVHVRGAKTYPAAGTLRFVTIRTDECTLFDAVRGWIDPTVDVVPHGAAARGGRTVWAANRDLMEASKVTAFAVALRELGYDVGEAGDGARVVSVVPHDPASTVLNPGDVIVNLVGRPIRFAEDVLDAEHSVDAGEIVSIGYRLQGAGPVLSGLIQLERLGGGRIGLGAQLTTNDRRFHLPLDTGIDTGTVVGPSAGLAFTLAYLEALAPNDLVGRNDVAATGTIDADGRVGEIGGMRQKVIAAQRQHVTLLLVPSTEAADARRFAHGSFDVVGVSTIDDALAALRDRGGAPLPRHVRAARPVHAEVVSA